MRSNSSDRVPIPLLGYEVQIEIIKKEAPVSVGESDPEIREQEAFGWAHGNYGGANHYFDQFKAPSSGRYRLRFTKERR